MQRFRFSAQFLLLRLFLGQALLCFFLTPAYSAGFFQCLWDQLHPVRMTPVHSQKSVSMAQAYEQLQSQNYLLKQNALHLPLKQHGATCTSVSAINAMLALAESARPGSVSGLAKYSYLNSKRASIGNLHRTLMNDVMAMTIQQFKKSATAQLDYNQMRSIFWEVYGRQFGSMPPGASATPLRAQVLKVLELSEHQSLLMAVGSVSEGHSLTVTHLLPAQPGARPSELLRLMVSDPHAPNSSKILPVYQVGERYYLASYGKHGEKIEVGSGSEKTLVQAGEILNTMLINPKPRAKIKDWNRQSLESFAPKYRQLLDLYLSDGTVFKDVSMIHTSDEYFYIYDRDMKKLEFIYYSDVADVRLK